jgi:hypothetical protein
MNCRRTNPTAPRRLAAVCLVIGCCVLAACLVPTGAAAAAQGHDPSYSPEAQRQASLHLAALGSAAFDPDNVITDINFSDSAALTQAAVQSFLAAQSGVLKSYSAPDHLGVSRSAAAVICQAALAWQISPKVILVTLQKEQSLLSASRPSASALAWAMGCGVPDAGSPNTTYEGFGKQVWYGAESLHNDGQGFYAGIAKVCGDGTVQPVDQATYALYRYTPWIGLSGGGNKLFWTLYWQYFGNPLAVDTVAPKTTVAGADANWHDKPVTLTFSATDNAGGSGVASTQYKLDSGVWTTATRVTVSAPATHSADGTHTILYRSVDVAGNTEKARSCTVRIDTRRPKVVANWATTVTSGHTAGLLYYISDPRPGSPTATVTIRVRTSTGRLAKKLVVGAVAVDTRLAAKFVCKLTPGQYRFYIYATDAAGNTQVSVSSNRLIVR